MKKVVLTLTASLACLVAFGQGHIQFVNDSLHNVSYSGGDGIHTNGEAIYLGNMPSSGNLVMDLYMGTASGSLGFVSSTTFSASPGRFGPANVVAPFAGGTAVFVVAQVRSANDTHAATLDGNLIGTGSAYAAALGYSYYGWSQEFTFTLGSSPISYPLMTSASGTWAPGTVNMDSYGAGNRGAITASAVPEPTSMALLGLGTAAMLIFRRRK